MVVLGRRSEKTGGEVADGWWYLNAWALVEGNEGYIDYVKIRTNYYEGGDDWAFLGGVGCFIGIAAHRPPMDLYVKILCE